MIAIILLLVMLILALSDCLIRKDFRHSVIFAFPVIVVVGMYIWLFTLLPVRWGLKKMPFVEQAQIRVINDSDYAGIQYNGLEYNAVMEFVTDKEIGDYQPVLIGSNIGNFSWNDFIDNDTLAVLTSDVVTFIKQVDDNFLYKALFVVNQCDENQVSDSIYCKVFMRKMFTPVYETNEFVVSCNKLFQTKELDTLYIDTKETGNEIMYRLCLTKQSKQSVVFELKAEDDSSIDFVQSYKVDGVRKFDCFALYDNVADGNRFLFFDYENQTAYITSACFSGFYPICSSVDFANKEVLLKNESCNLKHPTDTLCIDNKDIYLPFTCNYQVIKAKFVPHIQIE